MGVRILFNNMNPTHLDPQQTADFTQGSSPTPQPVGTHMSPSQTAAFFAQPDKSNGNPIVNGLFDYGKMVVKNLGNTFSQGAQNVTKAVTDIPQNAQNAGGSPLADVASVATAAGHIAGDVAGTAGGILTSVLPPPPEKSLGKDIFNAIGSGISKIPGMTPDIQKGLSDVLNTALMGVGEKATPVVGDAIKSGVDTAVTSAKDMATAVTDKIPSIPNPKTAIENLMANPIPEQVKSALGESSAPTFDKYAQIAKNATASYKNQTPLEYAGTRAQEALDTIQRKLDNIGSTKSDVLNSAGVGDKPVGNMVTKFRQNLNSYLSGKTAIEGDTKMVNDISSQAQALGANPTASQVDKFIDFAQDRIYSGRKDLTVPVTDSTTAALRKFTGELNTSLKAKLPDSYSTLNSKYSDLVQTRNELNTKLGAEGEKGGALMKRVFSPSDANTKQLFADVKKSTGIDLVNESTIARYVMETVGDSRQASMLQQLQLPKMSPEGILQWARDFVGKKINSPDAMLNRAKKLTQPTQYREAK